MSGRDQSNITELNTIGTQVGKINTIIPKNLTNKQKNTK